MKKIIYMLMISAAVVLTSVSANAQMGKRYYVDAGWQFNTTLSNDFVDNSPGYGAYVESGYYLTPMLAVGGFMSFNINDRYYSRKTYYFEDKSAVTTDLTRSLYQVPFGASLRYRFMRKEFQPYIEAKIGAEYSIRGTYMSTFISMQDNWGFYVSPEVGLGCFPFAKTDIGFQFAAYYSYSTNFDDIDNVGFKLGIIF